MENEKEWLLESLSIYRTYGQTGIYNGSVKFRNGVSMEMSLLLDAEKCSKMVTILQDQIVESATKLGTMMVKSMPIQISEKSGEL
jgi:hypothetical protein